METQNTFLEQLICIIKENSTHADGWQEIECSINGNDYLVYYNVTQQSKQIEAETRLQPACWEILYSITKGNVYDSEGDEVFTDMNFEFKETW